MTHKNAVVGEVSCAHLTVRKIRHEVRGSLRKLLGHNKFFNGALKDDT